MAPRKRPRRRAWMAVLSLMYTAGMSYLLFLRRLLNGRAAYMRNYAAKYGYLRTLRQHTSLKLFKTVRHFWHVWRYNLHERGFQLMDRAFVNNVGNILAFVPIGFILPYFWKAQRNPLVCILTTILLISCVEVAQVTLLVGNCDIDDVLLNTIGSFLGYLIYCIYRRLKYGSKRNKRAGTGKV